MVKRTCYRRVDAVQDRQLLEQNLTQYIRPSKTQSVAAVRTESLMKAVSAEGKHDKTSNEVTCTLIEFRWKKESLAPFISRTPAVTKSCAGAGEDPFEKMRDSITDTINRLQTIAQSEASQTHQCIKEIDSVLGNENQFRQVTRCGTSVTAQHPADQFRHSRHGCTAAMRETSTTWERTGGKETRCTGP